MSIFCRLCAETKIASEIVTSINDPERLVEQKLIACCQWNPQNTDFELPQDVCRFCFNKLENCWSFLQSVQLAQRRIQNMFGENLSRFQVVFPYFIFFMLFFSKSLITIPNRKWDENQIKNQQHKEYENKICMQWMWEQFYIKTRSRETQVPLWWKQSKLQYLPENVNSTIDFN